MLDRADLVEHLLETARHPCVTQCAARRVHNDAVGLAGLRGEGLLQQVERPGRLSVRQLELAAVRATHPVAEADQHSEGEEPADDNELAVTKAPARKGAHDGTSRW